MKTWQEEESKGGRLENETAKRTGEALASAGGRGGGCYEMEIPACWSCWPVLGLEREEGLRVQLGGLLPGSGWSPGYREWTCHWLLLVNKPNTVGKIRCEAEDAAVSMSRRSPTCSGSSTPNFFLSCQQEIKYQPPSFTDALNSWTFRKPCAVLFVCHVVCWGSPKV